MASDYWDVIKSTYETEKWFWSLLTTPIEKAGLIIYDKPTNPLREANKIVVEGCPDEHQLRAAMAHSSVMRLVLAPESSTETCSDASLRQRLAGACGDAMLQPSGDACLYMVAAARTNPPPTQAPYEVRRLEPNVNTTDKETIRCLRSSKDCGIRRYEIREALLAWVEARATRSGFTTFVLFCNDVACGTVSAFESEGVTRLRDLFVLPNHRGRKAALLIAAVMQHFGPPYAVVTDSDNPARHAYRRSGFVPAYLQEAYTITHK